MTKFYGEIGYGESVQTPPGSGIWKDVITEQVYMGDVIRNSIVADEKQGDLNTDISVGNSISIIADENVIEHVSDIKYVMWMGKRWAVTNVVVQPPRLVLSIGSVYNGPTPTAP